MTGSGGGSAGSLGSVGSLGGSAGTSPGAAGLSSVGGTGGASSGGTSSGGVSSGGSATDGGSSAGGGAGGSSAGSGSGGGSSVAASPSPGCSKGTPRPSGGKVEVANTSLHLFPESYDGKKPFPLLISLHACGNPNTEFVNPTGGTGFGTEYVRTFPNTPDSGQCWSNYNTNSARVLAQYDELMNDYCIDQNRVFATGHSSGAQLLVNILAHKSDAEHLKLKGVAPIAADPFNVAVPMPIMYIAGQMDNQRSANSARDTIARFRTANSCTDTSKPYSAVMSCQSTDSGRPMVNPGCTIYDGCSVPTIWCSHNDPNYNGTQHGIPCFAMKAMYDFFGSL